MPEGMTKEELTISEKDQKWEVLRSTKIDKREMKWEERKRFWPYLRFVFTGFKCADRRSQRKRGGNYELHLTVTSDQGTGDSGFITV